MNPILAVAQMTSTEDIESNFYTVERLCKQAIQSNASLISFPENFAYLPTNAAKSAQVAQALGGELFSRYRSLATRFNIEISFGGFQERSNDGRFYNSHVLVGRTGEILSTYRKIHLFVVDIPSGPKFDESKNCDKGSEIVLGSSSVGQLGLSICYDLRFAELYQALAQKGAEILLVPSAFTAETGRAHWEILLRARAIENQCYVAAAAQYGEHHEGRVTHGHAMIVDPWGSVIAQCAHGEELAFAQIDLSYLRQVRENMPMHRQLHVLS